jgi:hypothetical protein
MTINDKRKLGRVLRVVEYGNGGKDLSRNGVNEVIRFLSITLAGDTDASYEKMCDTIYEGYNEAARIAHAR